MELARRSILRFSACALAMTVAPVGWALAAEDIGSVKLIDPLGKPAIGWTVLDLLRPALQEDLKSEVVVETIAGHDGIDAIRAVLEHHAGESRLLGIAIMGTQYAARLNETDPRLEDMTPIAKLTNGFSVTLFGKRGGPLKSWADLAAAKAPLKLSSPERRTASYVAVLMVQRKGALSAEVTTRDTIGEVIDDVIAGRSALGIASTGTVARQLDRLQPIVSFGARRNAMLSETPTFGEVTGNPQLAFTESIGVFASPNLAPALAARLTEAFLSAGNDMNVGSMAEAANIPLAVNGPEVLVETMKRNDRVPSELLG
jgi:tripartite-type tricarboxylate transporter receptor subunit TctC